MSIPVAPIPTGTQCIALRRLAQASHSRSHAGSANALCTNLFGVKDTYNIALACLNVIKGR